MFDFDLGLGCWSGCGWGFSLCVMVDVCCGLRRLWVFARCCCVGVVGLGLLLLFLVLDLLFWFDLICFWLRALFAVVGV